MSKIIIRSLNSSNSQLNTITPEELTKVTGGDSGPVTTNPPPNPGPSGGNSGWIWFGHCF